jgi:hypothetical protein
MSDSYCDRHKRNKVWLITTSFCPDCDAAPKASASSLASLFENRVNNLLLNELPTATWYGQMHTISMYTEATYPYPTQTYELLDDSLHQNYVIYLKDSSMYNDLITVLNELVLDRKAEVRQP